MRELREMFKHIKVLGRTNAYNKLNKELVIAPADPLVEEFSMIDPPPIPGMKPEQFTFVKACTPVEMAHLRNFDRPSHTPEARYTSAIEKAVEVVGGLLDLPEYLFFPDRHALHDVTFYPGKFAGMEYAQMGLKTRAEAHSIALMDAEAAYDKLAAGEDVLPHDVRLGGRGKVTELSEGQARTKPPPVGRLILMLSHRDLLLNGITENQLTRAYSAPEYPVAVGQSWYHGGSAAFLQRFKDYEEYFCFDAKKFDSGINPWMVRIAINILRTQYYKGTEKEYDTYWRFVYESLVRAPIYRDDGVRFQKEVGTTSGHSHNTLLQSIITLILGYAAYALLNPDCDVATLKENVWVESLGDDNIIGVRNGFVGASVEQIAETVWSALRIDWGGKKSFKTTRLLDPACSDFQGIQFLGKFWYLADYPVGERIVQQPLPYRPARETYLRLLYPEYGTIEPGQTYLRTLGNYLDAAGNRLMEHWLQRFMDWLDARGIEHVDEWPPNFKRMVSRDYSNVGVEVPRPVRINFAQWRDLVVLERTEYRRLWNVKADQAM